MAKTKPAPAVREKYLIAAVVITGLAIIAWHFGGVSNFNRINELRLEREHLQSELALLRSTVQNREHIEQEWVFLQQEKERLLKAVPCLSELPAVLGNLEKLLSGFDGSIHSLRLGETDFKENHATLSLTVKITDNPDRMQRLLERLENFDHLMLIDSLRWSNQNGAQAALEIDCRLVFILLDQPALDPEYYEGEMFL